MEKRLIYAEDLKQLRDDYISGKVKITYVDEYDMVDHCPTADPFKHGKWEFTEPDQHGNRKPKCSVCGTYNLAYFSDYGKCKYCPNCGAKMDK
jgi:hypothetical protein